MVASTGSSEEDDPGVAPGGSEAPIPAVISSTLTGELSHGSLVVDMVREKVFPYGFSCIMSGKFLVIPTPPEVRKIVNVSEDLFDKSYDSVGERGPFYDYVEVGMS